MFASWRVHVNMRVNNVNMQNIYVDMWVYYICMQDLYVNRQVISHVVIKKKTCM